MDDPGQQQDGTNTTTVELERKLKALSSYINNPEGTVIRIEDFVVVAAILLLLQLILGSCRRRSGHWFVQGALWLAYTLSFPIITYTLGQMMSSPVKNGLYPVWAVILLLISGCTNSVTAYDLDDNSKWRRYLFELLQYSFYLAIIFQLLYATRSVIPHINGTYMDAPQTHVQLIGFPFLFLFGVAIFNNLARVIAGRMATDSSPSKVVVDYMRDQVDERGAQDSFDPVRMKGYKYIVRSAHQAEGSGTRRRAAYRTQVRTDTLITIDTIWDMEFGDIPGAGSRLKDACLSFALSHLLKRRFFGMECSEAALPETRRFVLEGLLSGEDGVRSCTRAFHIVEVELGFLYDFFFTKYGVLFRMERSFLVMAVLKLIFITICGLFLLVAPPVVMTQDPVIEVNTRDADITITAVVMGALFLVEVLQAIFYLTSDWATVSLACTYPRRATCKFVPLIIWFHGIFNQSRKRKGDSKFLGGLNLFGYWQNKMGQFSVIEGCLHANINSVLCSPISYILHLLFSTPLAIKAFKPVPDLVKSKIVSCLHASRVGGPLTNGDAALERNGVTGELSWALANGNQATIMLIWHIATEYCNTASLAEAKLERDNYQEVAVTLSRYCAYLMSFVPDLLPGISTDTAFVSSCVQREVREMLRGRKPSRGTFLDVLGDSEVSINILGSRGNDDEDTASGINTKKGTDPHTSTNNRIEDTIFVQGLKLGKELEVKIEDDALRWKVMAEVWAETIVYVAPSENVKAHMERLAQGGEFLTHVWALLNHAGILERERKQTPEEIV